MAFDPKKFAGAHCGCRYQQDYRPTPVSYTHLGDDHAQPEPGTAPPPQKQPEHRHQHHIHGGQETGLGRGRVERDADLLGSGGRKQQGAAAKPRRQQKPAVGRGFGPAIGCAVPAVDVYKRQL